jgi:hypothetical protein
VEPDLSAAIRAGVFGCALLGALLLVVSEFTALFTIKTAAATIKTVSTGSHDSYALIPIALVAVGLAYLATARRSLPAFVALGALGVVTLLIALIGDLPDAQATGVVGSSATHFTSAAASPSTGLYMETLGAILLILASGCGLLLGGARRQDLSRRRSGS